MPNASNPSIFIYDEQSGDLAGIRAVDLEQVAALNWSSECAERALGRQLTLDDLEACGGNYAHYVMQTRLREDLELSIRCLSEVPGDR